MGRTRRELLDSIGSDELSEWRAFYQLEPWGEIRADMRNALLCSIIAKGLGGADISPEKFMVFSDHEPVKEKGKGYKVMSAWFAGKVKKRNGDTS